MAVIAAVYLDCIVPKVPAAGYDESDISSMGSAGLPLAPLHPRGSTAFSNLPQVLISEPAVPTASHRRLGS